MKDTLCLEKSGHVSMMEKLHIKATTKAMGPLAPGKGTLKDRRRKKVFFLYTLSGPTCLINHLHNFKNSDSKDKTLETLQKKR